MRISRGRRVLVLIAATSLFMAACGGDDDAATETTVADDAPETTVADDAPETTVADDAPETTVADDPPETTVADEGNGDDMGDAPCDATVPGSQIDYGIFAPNAAFDPVGSSGALVGGTEIAAVYDVLFIFDPTTLEVRPHLAESLTPDNDDFTVWTLTLREGITYSDGTPLTTQLVADNNARYFAEEGVRNTSGGFLQYIEETEIIDDTTMRFTLNTPFAEFGLVFADEPGMIVNLDVIGDDANELRTAGDDVEAFRVQPPDAAGVGPYVVERNVPGEETILKARSDYWGGPVCVETIRFTWIPGSAGTYDAFRSGELDVAFLRDPIVNQQAIDDGAEYFYFPQDGGAMINFNHREGRITADPRLREAIMLALDPEIINDRAYEGNLETTLSYIGPNSPYFSDAVETRELDTGRAAALVDEVKADGWDGTLNFVASNAPPGPDTAIAIEAMLGAVGIELETELMATGDSIARLGTGDFDIITNGWNSGPGTMVLSLVRNLSSNSPTNRMGYASDEMDALLDEALATQFADLPPVMAAINNQINDEFVSPPYASTSEGVVWADHVSGLVPTVSTIFLFHDAVVEN